MKKYILFFFILCTLAFSSILASAQCNPATASPIRCGFYDEGYQDGASDGRSNQNDDYRRYRSKFDRQYESFYRDGYSAGYDSVRPSTRWTNSQRSAYNSGYTIGLNDRRSPGRNSVQGALGRYDQNIALYFQQGYDDGFSGRNRTYDVPVGTNPPLPGPGGGGGGGGGNTGTAFWSGRVDDRVNVIFRGNSITTQNISGNTLQTFTQGINGRMPNRPSIITARKTDGRGDVTVIQQPDRSNNFTTIVEIFDRNSGADNYRFELSWAAAANVEEPYSSGNVRWRGRVDQTVNVIISGNSVQSQDTTGTGLSNVTFDLNGYLANRPGSVNVRKRNGRGTVTVLQQPSRFNDYTAIVQIFDPNSGADNYEIDITW